MANALEKYRKTQNPGEANLSVSRKGLSSMAYAQASQQANLDSWSAQGIDAATGRQIATPGSGNRAPITQNVRADGNNGAAGTWTAGGNDPMKGIGGLVDSANAGGRLNGLWTPEMIDSHGNKIASVNTHTPNVALDGTRTGAQKLEAYNNAWQDSPVYSDGASYRPTTQAQLDSLDGGRPNVTAPKYYNDVRSNDFFERYGQMYGPDEAAPSVNYGYENETARGQNTASYQNKLVFDKWTQSGNKEPVVQNKYNSEGGWMGVQLVGSSGNDALDQAYMQRAQAAQGKTLTPAMIQKYEGGISSAMMKDLGYDNEVSNDIWNKTNSYRKQLDASARAALAGIANAGDIDENLSSMDLRRMQKESQRDEALERAQEAHDTAANAKKAEAQTLKDKNTNDINRLMEERIAELKRTGRVVVGPDGEYTTGSQQLMDKIRADFKAQLTTMNGDIDSKLDLNLASFSSSLTDAQNAAHNGYYEFFDNAMAQQQATDAENDAAYRDAEIEKEANLLEMKGFDIDQATKMAKLQQQYQNMNSEEINMNAAGINDLYYQMNGVEAPEGFIQEMQANADAKEEKAELAAAAKKNPTIAQYELNDADREWLFKKENSGVKTSFFSTNAEAQKYAYAQIKANSGYNTEEPEDSTWFSRTFRSDDEPEYNTQTTAPGGNPPPTTGSSMEDTRTWLEGAE